MNYFEYIELENIIGHKRAVTKYFKNNDILYGLKGAKLNMVPVAGKQFTPHWAQTVSLFLSALTPMPLMPIHNDDSEPARTNWAQLRLASFSFLSANDATQQGASLQPLSEDVLERMSLAMDYLLSNSNMSPEGAAGVVGVFMAESGLKPGIQNSNETEALGDSAGKGLGQWSNSRRKLYDEFAKGKESSLQTDLDFFLHDLESRPLVKQILTTTTSIEDAVKAMHLGYENGTSEAMATPELMTQTYAPKWRKYGYRPYNYSDEHDKRLKHAKAAYQTI